MDVETEFCADENLRERIMLSVIKSVEMEAQALHLTVSPQAMTAISAIVLKYLEQLARDLEMFAQHAGRKSVNMDDVILAVRRNPSVVANLMAVVGELTNSKKNQAEKPKKKQQDLEDPVQKVKRKKKDADQVQAGKLKKRQEDVQSEELLEFDEGERLRKKFMT